MTTSDFGSGAIAAYTPTFGISAAGGFTASPRLVHSGGMPPTISTDGNNSTPSTTETYVCEMFVPCNMTATGLAQFNGSAQTDDMILILYNVAGVPIAYTAATTASGADTYQRIAFASPVALVGPATYFCGLQVDGTTLRFNSHILGNFAAWKETSTTFGTIAAVTPATTFTTALGPMMTLY